MQLTYNKGNALCANNRKAFLLNTSQSKLPVGCTQRHKNTKLKKESCKLIKIYILFNKQNSRQVGQP